MNEQVTRQILWNIPVAFVVIMYTLLAALGVAFVYAGMYWYRRITLGTSEDRFDQLIQPHSAWPKRVTRWRQGFVVREQHKEAGMSLQSSDTAVHRAAPSAPPS